MLGSNLIATKSNPKCITKSTNKVDQKKNHVNLRRMLIVLNATTPLWVNKRKSQTRN